MYRLYLQIKRAKISNKIMYDTIIQFSPLIKRYSTLLFMEKADAIAELTTEFIRIIKGFPTENNIQDKYVLSYIKKSIRNSYIAISKKQTKFTIVYFDDIENFEPGYFSESSIWFTDLLSSLTPLQKDVIILKYIYGYSDVEIATRKKITRQAVNQIKNRGLKKLKAII